MTLEGWATHGILDYKRTGLTLGKTYSVLCVFEQTGVDKSCAGPLSAGPNWVQLVQLA
jgi:hypothetical protein